MALRVYENRNLRKYQRVALAEALDKSFGRHELIVGGDGAFLEEISAPFGDFLSIDTCIIILDWRYLTPLLYRYAFGDDASSVIREFKAQCDTLARGIESFRGVRDVPVLIFSPLTDHGSSSGFINRLLDPSPLELFYQCQMIFNTLCRGFTDAYPIDLEEIGARLGKDRAYHPLSAAASHQPFSIALLDAVARHIHAVLTQLRSYPLKCIVLDLDNTLWEGVVGEDGFEHIRLGKSGVGKAYRDFQEELLKYYKQGTLLAVCSKNNTCDALDVIERHPDMLLRPNMISCYRINWEDKPKNIVEIAAELNIGLDSILFIDDSPVERAIVRSALPAETILELPAEPALFADAIRACTRLWPVQLTKSDLGRTASFVGDNKRLNLKKNSLNKEAYLKGLEIALTMHPAMPDSLERVTQLFNKTNQFNLTGARFTQGELERLAGGTENGLFCMEMSDRFGDYGIIGVALTKADAIEAFALSCLGCSADI